MRATQQSFWQQPDIDGGLIGGASLKPVDFSKIIAATAQGACE